MITRPPYPMAASGRGNRAIDVPQSALCCHRRRPLTFRRGVGFVECFRKFPLMCATDDPSNSNRPGIRKLFETTRRNRGLDAIPPPSSDTFRNPVGKIEAVIRKPLIHIEIFPGFSDARRKVREMVRSRNMEVSGNKKGLTNFALAGHRKPCWLS